MNRLNDPFGHGIRATHGPGPETWQEKAMLIRLKLEDGSRATVIIRSKTMGRLRGTCFRGPSVTCAGNFQRWSSAQAFMCDELVVKHLSAEISDLWKEREGFGTNSVTITHKEFVGWTSTAPLQKFTEDSLEEFSPNRKSLGKKIRLERTDLRAPKTRDLTLVFEFKAEDGRPVAVIHSIYPGPDVGELRDDVSAREQCVFFDWSHPGEE